MAEPAPESRLSPPDPPRWLSAEEQHTWIAWVFSTRLIWEELERDLQRGCG